MIYYTEVTVTTTLPGPILTDKKSNSPQYKVGWTVLDIKSWGIRWWLGWPVRQAWSPCWWLEGLVLKVVGCVLSGGDWPGGSQWCSAADGSMAVTGRVYTDTATLTNTPLGTTRQVTKHLQPPVSLERVSPSDVISFPPPVLSLLSSTVKQIFADWVQSDLPGGRLQSYDIYFRYLIRLMIFLCYQNWYEFHSDG